MNLYLDPYAPSGMNEVEILRILLLKRPPLFSDMFHRICLNPDGEGL